MRATEIERVSVSETDELRLSTELACDAKTLLGYDAQHVAVYGELSKALK